MIENQHLGSSFESFLEGEGVLEAVDALALKRVLAWQLEQAMTEQGLSKAAMAKRMNTSRAALDRLLDPNNSSVTLNTLGRAATMVGKRLRLELVDAA